MIYATAIIVLLLVVDLATDLRRWYAGKPINHVRGALLRVPAFGAACWLEPYATGLFLVGYFILFNGLIAVLKGHGWLYVGSTSWIDRMLRKLPGKWAYVVLQAVMVAAAIWIYTKKPG